MITHLRLATFIVLLAGVDLAAAVALKESRLREAPLLFLAGAGCFVLLAVVLYNTVELTALTWISLGWVVIHQCMVMAVDRYWYDVTLTRVQVGAVAVALVALVVAALAGEADPG